MTLDENDYLTYQLYTASKMPRINRARIRGWITTSVAFLILTYWFFENGNDFLGFYFLVISILSVALYPLYSRWRYKRHYLKFILDTYKNRFGEDSSIEFNDDTIVTRDKTGESKINVSEIEEINEIRDFYFIKFNTGVSLIISKTKTEDLDAIKNSLLSLIERKGIKHNSELDWKWR